VVAVAQPLDDLMRYQLSRCRELGACITDIVNFFEREAGKILLEGADRGLFAEDPVFSCEGEKEPAGKRAFDLMAAFCLLALFWPLMLLAALAIWIEDGSGAPVLYRQRRVGRDGRFFDVVKFRTMSVNAESDGQARWAAKRDPRITRVGSFLRRTRIDELPQIFNVLVGEMALVGPRPERPEFVRELSRKIPHYAQRHCVKPGITGWAQTHYPYGSCETDAANKTEFDLYYVKNRSLFLDALVLLQTVEIILFAKGAR
jgi:exopolysaccharide biosynthesis polyprenyl glycosylphosphotransferase